MHTSFPSLHSANKQAALKKQNKKIGSDSFKHLWQHGTFIIAWKQWFGAISMGGLLLTEPPKLPPPMLSDFSQVSIHPVKFEIADKKSQAELWGT